MFTDCEDALVYAGWEHVRSLQLASCGLLEWGSRRALLREAEKNVLHGTYDCLISGIEFSIRATIACYNYGPNLETLRPGTPSRRGVPAVESHGTVTNVVIQVHGRAERFLP